MFIRQTRTNNTATGEGYFTYRLVRSTRIEGKVRQITILNLGRHFAVKNDDWPLLCSRIELLLQPQAHWVAIDCPAPIERAAQRIYEQIVARAPRPRSPSPRPPPTTRKSISTPCSTPNLVRWASSMSPCMR